MIIRISIEAASTEKHTHLKRNFYRLLKRLGFTIHFDRTVVHNGTEEKAFYLLDDQSWSSLTAIRESDKGPVWPQEESFEGQTDLLMWPFIKNQPRTQPTP